jgi:hypothetical protein
MDTRKVAKAYRLSHWAGILRDRGTRGESIKGYCERIGIHENTYYYWQRKLREAAFESIKEETQVGPSNPGESLVPSGWAVCAVPECPSGNGSRASEETGVHIQIGQCAVKATSGTNMETLAQVCKVLVSLC